MPRTEIPSDRGEIIVSRPILASPRAVYREEGAYTGTCNVQDQFTAGGVVPLEGSSPDVYDLLGNTWVDVSGSFVRGPVYYACHTGTQTMAISVIDCYDDWRDGVCGIVSGLVYFGTGSLAGYERDVGYVMRRSGNDYIAVYARMNAAEDAMSVHIDVVEGGTVIQSVASETLAMYGEYQAYLWISFSGRDIHAHAFNFAWPDINTTMTSLLTDKFIQNTQYGLYFRGDAASPDAGWMDIRVAGATQMYRIIA